MSADSTTWLSTCAPPDPHPRTPRIALPPGAWDCHAHIVGAPDRYPLAPGRSYNPAPADLSAYEHLLSKLGLARAVIVQPSFYGNDNRTTLDALRGHSHWRGVVVVDPAIDDATLHAMHNAGVRGVRINLLFSGGGVDLDALERTAERVRPLGWHIELLANGRMLSALEARLRRLPVAIVFDHMGHVPASAGKDDPGFRSLLRLVAQGQCWVKLSGVYRVSGRVADYADVAPMARALIEAAADRLLWGSDWPHPAIQGPMPDDAGLIELLADWTPDPGLRERIFVTNPNALYDAE